MLSKVNITNYTNMKELKKEQLISLMGGWLDPEECKKLQEKACEYDKDSPEWDDWVDDFEKYCLGIDGE